LHRETRFRFQLILMKRLLYLLLAGLPFFSIAQDSTNKVVWNFDLNKSASGTYQLVISGKIAKGWNLFSVAMPDDLPNTRVVIDSGTKAEIMSVQETPAPVSEKSEVLGTNVKYFAGQVQIKVDLKISDPAADLKGKVNFMVFSGDNFDNPVEVPFRFKPDGNGNFVYKSSQLGESAETGNLIRRTAIDINNPVLKVGGTGAEGEHSLWRIFLLGLLGGLIALIMPCTFPMIPMTVFFFTKKSVSPSQGIRNAFIYGFFIFLIYVLVSAPFYFLEGKGQASILNTISTNAWVNIFFSLVFLVFALSFFGLFEIGIPSSLANKVDSKAGIGSISGIFFMAMTLAIVSFSCTGPILGSLIVGAFGQSGGAFQLTVALAGFGIALGLPFGLFAMFPQWLAKLPRSGSWMNTVKIVLAFVELALFIKYFSNADLVKHWGLLKREVFIGIWVAIAFATALFLFGVIKFKSDDTSGGIGKGRLTWGILFGAIGLYLLPGLTNTKYANLSLISGFPPPLNYSLYKHENGREKGLEANVVNDYFKALELAKKENKPILIDFTGWACVNCRKMEEQVWPDERVKSIIKENYILVSLYVDDRKKLEDDKQFLYTLSDGSKKSIREVGDFYSSMQVENFNNASQPLYALISPDEKLLTLPVGYTSSITEYANWLRKGLEAKKILEQSAAKK